MPTRNALFFLFLLLVFVPVGAAAYLGAKGVDRERDMLIAREREALRRRADDVRDALVRALQRLYATEFTQSVQAFAQKGGDGDQSPVVARLETRSVDEAAPKRGVPAGWTQLVESPSIRDWLAGRGRHVAARAIGAPDSNAGSVSDFDTAGEWNYRTIQRPGGERSVQGVLVSAERINRLYLDPASSQSVIARFDPRVDAVRLVRDDPRERVAGRDGFGLPHAHYRFVVPPKYDTPVLMPPGHVLKITVRPDPALGDDINAAGAQLRWTMLVVGTIVALGLVFFWRALRAEARLAARRSDFVNAVSHELRTPLTSIRMYADMLKEGWVKDADNAREYVGLLSAESERLARLVHNVLDFASMEKGGRRFEMQIGDPAPVVREAAEVLRPYLKSKNFELHIDTPTTLPACSFDRDALIQILVNLIDNAVKYGAQEVRIEASAEDGRVRFAVLDRGPGVNAQERERIFFPFERGEHTRTGGSGLGLALVRHYVEAHRGEISVTDRSGGGAVFAITLPVVG